MKCNIVGIIGLNGVTEGEKKIIWFQQDHKDRVNSREQSGQEKDDAAWNK